MPAGSPPDNVISLEERAAAERAKAAEEGLKSQLLLTAKGAIRPCEHNALQILRVESDYDTLHFDTFQSSLRLKGADWSDHDERHLLGAIQWKYSIPTLKLQHIHHAVLALAWERRRDALTQFLQTLPEWDGIERIDMALTDAFGAENTELTRAASRNLFIALMARAVRPGCQVDTLWVIEGPQGSFKSRAMRALGGEFHSEISAGVGTTDFMRELRGVWLAELSELDSLRGREASTIKRLLSAPSDRFVEKYQIYPVRYQRRAIAIATTNEAEYWQDATGARRLIPITAGEISIKSIEDMRLQWFAEALSAFKDGATWWEFPASIEQERDDRQQIDPWEGFLERAIVDGQQRDDPIGGKMIVQWPDGWISSAEIFSDWLGLKPGQTGTGGGQRIGKIMRRLGFVPSRKPGGSRERGWVKGAGCLF